MKLARIVPAALVLAALPLAASGQSFNIDFGSPGSAPSLSYDAAGATGAWNAIGVLDPFVRVPIADVNGNSTGVELYMFGGTQLLDVDVPQTSGDDAALLDDMLIGFNDPTDVCVWIDHLANGSYEVLIYAMTPGDPAHHNEVRVDFSTPGPQWVGGAWPGTQMEHVTFGRHTITITNGRIALHSGLYGGHFQSGINGVQIRPLSSSSVEPQAAATRVLGVLPNPACGRQEIAFQIGARPARGLEICDAAGRVVWHQALAGLGTGPHAIEWDGRDRAGIRVPAAAYFVRLTGIEAGTSAPPRKLIRID